MRFRIKSGQSARRFVFHRTPAPAKPPQPSAPRAADLDNPYGLPPPAHALPHKERAERPPVRVRPHPVPRKAPAAVRAPRSRPRQPLRAVLRHRPQPRGPLKKQTRPLTQSCRTALCGSFFCRGRTLSAHFCFLFSSFFIRLI